MTLSLKIVHVHVGLVRNMKIENIEHHNFTAIIHNLHIIIIDLILLVNDSVVIVL